MLLRTSYQYVKPGFDFVRWLLALRRKWYLFILSLFIGGLAFTVIYKLTPERYDVTSMYFVTKDVETDIFGAEIRIPLLRIFAKQNNIENHIGVLKSNEMLYDCLLELKRHITYSSNSDRTDIELVFTSDFYPSDAEFSILKINEDSLNITFHGGYKNLVLKSNGYIQGKYLFKRETQLVSLNQEIKFGNVTCTVKSKTGLPKNALATTNDLQTLMVKYDQRIRIKTLEKRATIISLGLSTADPEKDKKLVSLLMHKTIDKIKNDEQVLAFNTAEAIRTKLDSKINELEKLSLDRQNIKQNKAITDFSLDIRSKLKDISSLYEDLDILSANQKTLENCKKELKENGALLSPSFLSVKDPSLFKAIHEYHKLLVDLESEKVFKNNTYSRGLNEKVKAMKAFVLAKLQSGVDHHQILLEGILDEIAEINNEIELYPKLERELGALDRKISYLEKETFRLNKKLSETLMAPNYNASTIKILEKAVPKSKPFAPLKGEGYIVTTFIVLFFPLVIVFLDGILGSRIYSESQIKQLISEKSIGTLNRFIFPKKKPYLFNDNGERYAEEFTLFFKEIMFNVKHKIKIDQNLVLGLHVLHAKNDGLNLTTNMARCSNSMGHKSCEISIEHNSDHFDLDSIDFQDTYIKIVLDSSWLDKTDDFKLLLAKIKKSYAYTFIQIPVNIPNERRTVLSQFLDVNLGLAREHYTRENNILSFKETLTRISNKPARIIYLKGYMKKIDWLRNLEQYSGYMTYKEMIMRLVSVKRLKALWK